MSISELDIKRLWGRAAGRCAYPTCGIDCLPFLDPGEPTVVGEMAHVIARKSTTLRRGRADAGDDTYDNLVLLCPTHHTYVDKAPEGTFTEQMLLQWKADHEVKIAATLASPLFRDRQSLNAFVRPLLIHNQVCWATYGPESLAAKANPLSNAAYFWPFRKLSLIVPNNRRIVMAAQTNPQLFSPTDYITACSFIEHAEGFERNCTFPTENVPRFPKDFGGLFDG